MRLAVVFALVQTAASWQCPQLPVGEAYAPSYPVEAICVVSDGLPSGKVIKVDVSTFDRGWAGRRVCLRVQALTKPNSVSEQSACGDAASASIILMEPTVPHTYVILPQLEGGGSPPAMRFFAHEEDAPAPSPPPSPQLPHLPHPPPPPLKAGGLTPPTATGRSPPFLPPGVPPDNSDCSQYETDTLSACQDDLARLCPHVEGRANQLNCIVEYKQETSRTCQQFIHQLDECILTPHLLVPMEIASMLLLATASIVLLCTLLRCCCRYVCISPVQINDDLSTLHDEELSDEDESVGSVTPLPSGVKMTEPQVVEQPQEDELPAYTEVVSGATITRSSTPPPSSQIQLSTPHATLP